VVYEYLCYLITFLIKVHNYFLQGQVPVLQKYIIIARTSDSSSYVSPANSTDVVVPLNLQSVLLL